MGLLENASQWLTDQCQAHLSKEVRYRPTGSYAIFTAHALKGETRFKAENAYGTIVRMESDDFLIPASQLQRMPCLGDTIECEGHQYEVLAPNNEPVWRWSGPNHDVVRIHTKEIGATNG
jgi:hypothetical protein